MVKIDCIINIIQECDNGVEFTVGDWLHVLLKYIYRSKWIFEVLMADEILI